VSNYSLADNLRDFADVKDVTRAFGPMLAAKKAGYAITLHLDSGKQSLSSSSKESLAKHYLHYSNTYTS